MPSVVANGVTYDKLPTRCDSVKVDPRVTMWFSNIWDLGVIELTF